MASSARVFWRSLFVSIACLLVVYSIGYQCLAAAPDLDSGASIDQADRWEEYMEDRPDEGKRKLVLMTDAEFAAWRGGRTLDSGADLDSGPVVTLGSLNMQQPPSSVAESVNQIRYCVIFLTFGVVPLVCACVIAYVLYRWIYRLIVGCV